MPANHIGSTSKSDNHVPFNPSGFLLTIYCLALFTIGTIAAADDGVQFVDVTQSAGIHFTHVDGRSGQKFFMETIGSGAAFFDYDNDGYPDLYFVNGAPLPGYQSTEIPINQLYRNNRDGTFTDVTEKAGVGDTGYGHGCAVGDYNGDGYPDLYVTNYGPNVLYRNNGDGTFTDVTEDARVGEPKWSSGCAFADYDRDGDLDLYVVNYIEFSIENNPWCGRKDKGIRGYCQPDDFPGLPDTLYQNNGDGTFTDVTRNSEFTIRMGKAWVWCGAITTMMGIRTSTSPMTPQKTSYSRTKGMANLKKSASSSASRSAKLVSPRTAWARLLATGTTMVGWI